MKNQPKQVKPIPLFCGECGGGVRMRLKRSKNRKAPRVYKCPYGHFYAQSIILKPRSKTLPDSAA